MKVLLIDCGANFLDFALRCKKAGHTVKWFIAPDKNGERLKVGDGLVEKVSDFHDWMRWADIVILSDNVKYLHQLERYRKFGYPIFGCNVAASEMELDRECGQDVLKKAGVKILPYETFNNYDQAIAHVKRTMKRFVSKPSGDADKALSYVSKSPADMVYMLQRWKKMGRNKAPFILQEFVGGIEMAVGGFFGPGGWNSHFLENFEQKKLMPGDLGVNTGEMGTIMRYVTKSKLAEKLLFPISEYLAEIGYTGYIDVAAIIDDKGEANFLEYTCRPGWPCFQIQQALHAGDPVQWMKDLLDGYDSLEVTDKTAVGVVCAMPDFPYNQKPRAELTGIPVYCDIESPDIHPADIMAGVAPNVVGNKVVDLPTWVTAGNYILVATGAADTVSGARRRAYKVLDEIEIPNSVFWRNDIGMRLKEQLPELHKLGYAKDFQF